MIDLHTHVLPGLDDGPATLEGAVAMARVAAGAGTNVLVATPHIREDYPFSLDLIDARAIELQEELDSRDLRLKIVTGGELALSMVGELDDDALRKISLGPGPYLLVEAPYSYATGLLESSIFDLQVRGFRPVLAHPERSPAFLAEPNRLETLVKRKVLCAVTAAALEGQFGSRVRRFALMLIDRGLAHIVASDAHDDRGRPPLLRPGLEVSAGTSNVARDRQDWLVNVVPAAVLAGNDIPVPPQSSQRRRRPRGFFRPGSSG